jgi:hypothetical protein
MKTDAEERRANNIMERLSPDEMLGRFKYDPGASNGLMMQWRVGIPRAARSLGMAVHRKVWGDSTGTHLLTLVEFVPVQIQEAYEAGHCSLENLRSTITRYYCVSPMTGKNHFIEVYAV